MIYKGLYSIYCRSIGLDRIRNIPGEKRSIGSITREHTLIENTVRGWNTLIENIVRGWNTLIKNIVRGGTH